MPSESLARITHLEVRVEGLEVHRLPPREGAVCVALSEAIRFYPYPYPGGGMGNVQSIQHVLENARMTRQLIAEHLGIQEEFVEAFNACFGIKSQPVREDRFYDLVRRIDDCLINWNALLIANTIQQRCCPGFSRMCRVWQVQPGGNKAYLSIVLLRDREKLPAAVAMSRLRDIHFVGELEVDGQGGVVKEITGKRAGHCYE